MGIPALFVDYLLGYSVTVARLTLDQLVGVRIPVPQFLLSAKAGFLRPQSVHRR